MGLYLADTAAGDRQDAKEDANYESIPIHMFQTRLALILNHDVWLSLNTTVTLGNDGLNNDGLGTDLTSRCYYSYEMFEIFANTTGSWTG